MSTMQRKSKAPETEFVSVPEFAVMAGRTRQAINNAISNGWLPGVVRRAGPGRQHWRVPLAALSIYKA
jgi:hypothetical protein